MYNENTAQPSETFSRKKAKTPKDRDEVAAARAVRDYERWTEYLSTVVEFITEAGRMPMKRPDDLAEARYFQWISGQRQQLKAGTLTQERQDALDKAIPTWRQVRTNADAWVPAAARAQAFLAEHSRLPHADADDEVERTAGRWLAKQRLAEGELTAEQRAHLDQAVPGWRQSPKNVAPRKRVAAEQPAFDYERQEFYRWPFHIFDFLERPRRRPLSPAANLVDFRGRVLDEVAEAAFGDHLETLISTVFEVFPKRRPTLAGAAALFTWVEWAELEMQSHGPDSIREFRHALLTGAATLMASKIGVSDMVNDLAVGDDVADFGMYMAANNAAINRGIAQGDLNAWADGLRGREDDPFLRGQAIAGVALAQMDVWWGFRYGPTPAATGVPYGS